MARDRYDTNLASEFYVLAALHRLGADASLSLGNKKCVDITVVHEAGDTSTIDVKGVAGKHDWPVGNIGTRAESFSRNCAGVQCPRLYSASRNLIP